MGIWAISRHSKFRRWASSRLVRMTSFGMAVMMLLQMVFYTPGSIFAQSTTCSVDISTHEVPVGSDVGFDFTVIDTDQYIRWIRITAPYGGMSIYDASAVSFQSTYTANDVVFDGAELGINEPTALHVVASIFQDAPTQYWSVEVSSDSGGLDPVSCSGDTSLQLTNNNPPVISSISAAITSTEVTISWQTDSFTNSLVEYGQTLDYSDQVSDEQFVTGHSLVLSGLEPSTTYHYRITSIDQSSNSSSSADNTFTTSSLLATPPSTPPTSGDPIPQSIGQPTFLEAPTESVPPTVRFDAALERQYKDTPVITGVATDNVAVATVQYSTDGGLNWLPVNGAKGIGTPFVTFFFQPQSLQDGNFQVLARAIDTSRNFATTNAQTLVIDRLPPTVGGVQTSIGTQATQPIDGSTLAALVGVDQKMTVGMVGGPIKVTLTANRKGDDESVTPHFDFSQIAGSGVWSGVLSFRKPGRYQLNFESVDGAGNKTTRPLGDIVVGSPGRVVDQNNETVTDAELTVYYKDLETNNWVLWDATSYGQKNPISLNSQNSIYSLFMPAGEYYIKSRAKGFRDFVSTRFTLDKPTAIAPNIMMKHKPRIGIGSVGFDLPLPTISASPLKSLSPVGNIMNTSAVATVTKFSLPLTNGQTLSTIDLLGKPTVLSFVTTWSESAKQQISILDSVNNPNVNIVPVYLGESLQKVTVYNAIAKYQLPALVDSDNQLVELFQPIGLPTHYFIDRHGTVKNIKVGILSTKEILDSIEY